MQKNCMDCKFFSNAFCVNKNAGPIGTDLVAMRGTVRTRHMRGEPCGPDAKYFESKKRMNIYVASSWRNEFQPLVVAALREDGHEVYDFKDADGFSWMEVSPNWQNWTPAEYLAGLQHDAAQRGFKRDMSHLINADACVYVMPCGVSASWEAGYMAGRGKPVIVYVPALREPDLMVKMADVVTDDLDQVRSYLKAQRWHT